MTTHARTHKILLILGHPNPQSYCASLAQTYLESALAQGHEVRQLNLNELQFDPILRKGYATEDTDSAQTLEPDLAAAQADILWASHLVWVYPIWWGSMPALLKGFIDRVFLPGYAFQYRKNSIFWDKLLRGRQALLLVTLDTPAWYFRWVYRMPGHNQMKLTILNWCGIAPVRIKSFGPIHGSSPQQREHWLRQVAKMAGKH